MRKEDIDEVVLVGGSTRIPKVRSMLHEFLGELAFLCAPVLYMVAVMTYHGPPICDLAHVKPSTDRQGAVQHGGS